MRLVTVGTIAFVMACASTPKSVSDPAIQCDVSKQCASICGFYEKAESGDAKAQAILAEAYATGAGCDSIDFQKSVDWARKSAAQGNAMAMHRLGESYHLGNGVEQDDLQALQWYRRAADAGYDGAIKRVFHKPGYVTVAEKYRRLRASLTPALLQRTATRLDEIEVIKVTTRWRDGEAKLGAPRSGVATVSGRLGTSGALGGAFLLAGGPIAAAFYGGLAAIAAIKGGIEDGISANAIHEELDGLFRQIDLAELVQSQTRKLLSEAGLSHTPVVVMAQPDASELKPGAGEVAVELELVEAELKNSYGAWQFESGSRPAMVLRIAANVHVTHAGEKPFVASGGEYVGQTTLDGLEPSFRAEVDNAARYLAGEILLAVVQFEPPVPPVQEQDEQR